MVARALIGKKATLFDRWLENARFQKETRERKQAQDEAKIRRSLNMIRNRILTQSFLLLSIHRVRSKGVKRMVLRRLMSQKRNIFVSWSKFVKEEIFRRHRREQANQVKLRMFLARMRSQTLVKCFNMLARNAYQMRNVKRMMRNALAGHLQYNFEKWQDITLTMLATTALVKFHKFLEKYTLEKVLTSLNKADFNRVHEVLNTEPNEIERDDIAFLESLKKPMTDYAKLVHRMAIRVQCAYRCKQGRFTLFLKKRAYEQRMKEEAEWRRLADIAVRKLQRIVRGRQGRQSFADLIAKMRKEKMQEAYLKERKAAVNREKWRREMKEQLEREALTAEFEQKKRAQAIKLYEEKKTWREAVNKAWEEVPIQDGSGGIYYYNSLSGETSWEIPYGYKLVLEEKERKRAEEEQRQKKEEEERKRKEEEEEQKRKGYLLHKPQPPSLADWEEIESENGVVYYFNKITGESSWDPPKGWKVKEKEKDTRMIPKDMCEKCVTTRATRKCVDCDMAYCFDCFAKHHRTGKQLRHKVNVYTSAMKSDPFKCCNDNAPDTGMPCVRDARRLCKQCDLFYCELCYEDLHKIGDMAKHSYTAFKENAARCIECKGKLATKKCDFCGDCYCEACAKSTHSFGRLATHTFEDIQFQDREDLGEGDKYCIECDMRKATRVCDQCGDPYCTPCYERVHATGRRKEHTWQSFESAKTDWEEFTDEQTGETIYFNTKTKKSQKEKPPELMWGMEKMKYVHKVQQSEKEAAEAQELIKLKEQVAAFEEKEKKAKKDAKRAARNKKLGRMGRLRAMFRSEDESDEEDENDDDDTDDSDDEELKDLDEEEREKIKAKRKRNKAIRRRKRKAKKKAGKQTLTQAMMKNRSEAMRNPFKFARQFQKDRRDEEERYLRNMMLSKTKDPNEALEEEERKYVEGIMKELAEAREAERQRTYEATIKAKKENTELPDKKRKKRSKKYG
eukprot:g1995.t1